MLAGKPKATRGSRRDDQHAEPAQHRHELHGSTPCVAARTSCAEPPQRAAHTSCHDNGQAVTHSSRHAQKVIEESGLTAALHYADVGTHFGNASVRSTHATGAAPAFPEPITPPTMAHVVSTSPPTCAVVQKARS
ncbi:hypothetical protein ABIE67_006866 [Streptomyces sp. V4I8]